MPPFAVRTIPIAIVLLAVTIGVIVTASGALANSLLRRSFDRQVVAADVFVVGIGAGDRLRCPGDDLYGGMCTTVRVVRTLKGETPDEILLADGLFPESYPGCCEAGRVYAMALIRLQSGAYESTNGQFAIYDLGTDWHGEPPSRAGRTSEAIYRPLSFDQQVVESDIYVVARRTGGPHPCRNAYVQTDCVTFALIRAMKGETPATFEAASALRAYDLDSRGIVQHPYAYFETGQIYALALRAGHDGQFDPVSLDGVHRLLAP